MLRQGTLHQTRDVFFTVTDSLQTTGHLCELHEMDHAIREYGAGIVSRCSVYVRSQYFGRLQMAFRACASGESYHRRCIQNH